MFNLEHELYNTVQQTLFQDVQVIIQPIMATVEIMFVMQERIYITVLQIVEAVQRQVVVSTLMQL